MSLNNPEIRSLADACAALLTDSGSATASLLEPDFRALLDAVRRMDPRFAFDRDGRPGAIAVIRDALPVTEQEILDAVVEDHACELAAVHEAMFQVVLACLRRPDRH